MTDLDDRPVSTRVPRPVVRVHTATEGRNPRTLDLDTLPTIDLLRALNAEDRLVAVAVGEVLEPMARMVDLAVAAIESGRRVHYFGAGTSGRLGVLDAAELRPTFDAPDGWFVAHHAGGPAALLVAAEDVEDDVTAGRDEALESVEPGDLVVGVTASGRTPYVLGALEGARTRGAATALVCADPATTSDADVVVAFATGPEAVAGSTRLKAGTAQKLVLNGFSTAVMVRLGRTYSNLMVALVATNAKLRGRMVTILVEATGLPDEDCARALTASEGDLRVALVHLLSGAEPSVAGAALTTTGGRVRDALALLSQEHRTDSEVGR